MLTPEQKRNLEVIANEITDVKVRDNVKKGIAFHHAGIQTFLFF